MNVLLLLAFGVVFVVGFAAGGTVAEHGLESARRRLAAQRRAFWEERQDAVLAEAEIQRLLDRPERLRRIARDLIDDALLTEPEREPSDEPPPGRPAA